MKKSLLLLLIITIVGFLIRVVNVGSLPTILNRDEAALAYNALLLKETGRDEWGRSWPLALESFGDYKLPGYPLALIGSFWVFGYTDLAVRIPSVIAGTLLIAAAYWWARALKLSASASLIVSFMIAVTPIFWFYSRIAFEANLGLLLLVSSIGLSWFPSQVVKRSMADGLAIGLAVLAVFTYNTPLLLLPFVIVAIPFLRGVKQIKNWLVMVIGLSAVAVVAAMTLLPLSAQKSGITIFSDETVWNNWVVYRHQLPEEIQPVLGNRWVYYGQLIVRNILASFSPVFLVLQGGAHPWHQLPMWGHLYWSQYLFGLIGVGLAILVLGRHFKMDVAKESMKGIWHKVTSTGIWSPSLILLYLLGVSLLPSVVTVDAPHATRSLLFFFVLTLLVGKAVESLVRRTRKSFLYLVVIVLFGLEAARYGWLYFHQYPNHQGAFQPGLQQTLAEVDRLYPNQPVAMVDGGGYHYILVAWYQKLSPATFFATVVKQQPDQIGFKYGERVGRFRFIAKSSDRQSDETVLIEWDNQAQKWQLQTF